MDSGWRVLGPIVRVENTFQILLHRHMPLFVSQLTLVSFRKADD